MMIEKMDMTFIGLFTAPDIAHQFCKTSGFNFDDTFRSMSIVRIFQ